MKLTENFIIDLFKTNPGQERIIKIIQNYIKDSDRINCSRILTELKENLCQIFFELDVAETDFVIYGSTVLGLCVEGDYDLDLTLLISERTKHLLGKLAFDHVSTSEKFYKLIQNKDNGQNFVNLVFKPSSRCSVISFRYGYLRIKCDLTFNNWLAIENTVVIKNFLSTPLLIKTDYDFNLKNYVQILRIWLKFKANYGLKPSKLSPYAFTVMIFHFLLAKHYISPIMSAKHVKNFNNENIKTKSFEDLLYEFFYYYTLEFDASKYIADIRYLNGHTLSRKAYYDELETIFSNFDISHQNKSHYLDRNTFIESYVDEYRNVMDKFLCHPSRLLIDSTVPLIIQDPIELNHNLAKTLTIDSYNRFISKMKQTLNHFSNDRLKNHYSFNYLYLFDSNYYQVNELLNNYTKFPLFKINIPLSSDHAGIDLEIILRRYIYQIMLILTKEFFCTVKFTRKNSNQEILINQNTICDHLSSDFFENINNIRLLSIKFHSSMTTHWWKHSRRRRRANCSVELFNNETNDICYEYFCYIDPFTWTFNYYIKCISDINTDFLDFCANRFTIIFIIIVYFLCHNIRLIMP